MKETLMNLAPALLPVLATLLYAYLQHRKAFRYKDSLIKIAIAAKDGKVTEEEFQEIVDLVVKETLTKKEE